MSTKTRLEPQPPDMQPPWRTTARVELQIEGRAFAQEIVLPIADELDPQKAEMPRSLIDQVAAKGWFGITIPAEYGGMDSARKRSTTPAGSNCFAARPRQMDRGHRAI
jgi:alkylation response protein AidB-like acyl-CoA dehydrogenase